MNRRTVDTRLSSAPTHLIKREPGNEARSTLASFPGARLIKCVGAEESLVSTVLRFISHPRHSRGTAFSRIDDAMFCAVSIKFIVEKMASCCSRA